MEIGHKRIRVGYGRTVDARAMSRAVYLQDTVERSL